MQEEIWTNKHQTKVISILTLKESTTPLMPLDFQVQNEKVLVIIE